MADLGAISSVGGAQIDAPNHVARPINERSERHVGVRLVGRRRVDPWSRA
jgi:hypothetical protein